MNKFSFSLIILAFIYFSNTNELFSQISAPYIINFEYEIFQNAEILAIESDTKGNMIFASNKGIISFDGTECFVHSISTIVTSLKRYTDTDTIFAGSTNSFGYLKKDIYNNFSYIALKEDLTNEVIEIQVHSFLIYFFTKDQVYIYNKKTQEINTIQLKNNFLTNFIFTDKIVIVTTSGLMMIDNSEISELNLSNEPQNIIWGTALSPQRFVLTTESNDFFLFEKGKFSKIEFAESTFISDNIFLFASGINENEMIVTTLLSGACLVSVNSGEILYKINYQSGLANDEIFYTKIDDKDKLWISHYEGVSMVDFSLPINTFTTEGLTGDITDVCMYNDTLYVSTTEGLFYLENQKVYNSKELISRKKVRVETPDMHQYTNKHSKRFRRTLQNTSNISTSTIKTINIKSVIKELSERRNIFIRIQSINDKCKKIRTTPKGLIIAGNNGLYILSGKRTKTLFKDNYINTVEILQNDSIIVASHDDGIYFHNIYSESGKNLRLLEPIFASTLINKNEIVAGGNNKLFFINISTLEYNEVVFKNNYYSRIIPEIIDNELMLFSNGYIFKYDSERKTLVGTQLLSKTTYNSLIEYNNGIALFNNGWLFPNEEAKSNYFLNLFPNISCYHAGSDLIWFANKNNRIFQLAADASYFSKFNIYLKNVFCNDTLVDTKKSIVLDFSNNNLHLEFSAPYYILQKGVKYIYEIEGFDKPWKKITEDSKLILNFIPPGDYTLNVYAKNNLGLQSQKLEIKFSVNKPFTQTLLFYFIILCSIIIIGIIIFKIRLRTLQKSKDVLEQKVKERTKTIEEQKEEIASQRDLLLEINEEILQQKEEIETQRDEIESQRDKIAHQNNEIMQSIHYAKRIQTAVMPVDDKLRKYIADFFIYFKPRDIVSGDFYWTSAIDGKLIIAAADCTGHGVPGAFMSMLGVSLLNEVILKNRIFKSDEILNNLRNSIINTLTQSKTDKSEYHAYDGMDIAMCVIDTNAKTLEFSGAYNKLIMIRKGEIVEINGDRMPIGRHDKSKTPFTCHKVAIEKEDQFYLLTDGFKDQFGSNDGKKMKKPHLFNILHKVSGQSMIAQEQLLNEAFETWRNKYDQTDDVLVIGFKI